MAVSVDLVSPITTTVNYSGSPQNVYAPLEGLAGDPDNDWIIAAWGGGSASWNDTGGDGKGCAGGGGGGYARENALAVTASDYIECYAGKGGLVASSESGEASYAKLNGSTAIVTPNGGGYPAGQFTGGTGGTGGSDGDVQYTGGSGGGTDGKNNSGGGGGGEAANSDSNGDPGDPNTGQSGGLGGSSGDGGNGGNGGDKSFNGTPGVVPGGGGGGAGASVVGGMNGGNGRVLVGVPVHLYIPHVVALDAIGIM